MADPNAQPLQGLPISFEQVEELVKSMYEPGNARKIAETEATLRVLQRAPQGWELADALLGNKDEQVRFFGALTFTIKLNQDAAGLSEDDSRQLLQKFIHHLVAKPAISIATRKLCSTMAMYFCKPLSVWTRCIRSLVCSFNRQAPVLDDSLDEMPSTWDLLPNLTSGQLLCLLEFAMDVADEAKKLQGANRCVPPLNLLSSLIRISRPMFDRVLANIQDVEVLLQVSLGRGIRWLSTPDDNQDLQSEGESLCSASLKCFVVSVFSLCLRFYVTDGLQGLGFLRTSGTQTNT